MQPPPGGRDFQLDQSIEAGKKAPTGIVYQSEIFADTSTITDDIIIKKGINADPGKGVITK